MAKESNLKVKPMEQNYQCRFCKTSFHKETTLSTHMCVKKRRHMESDTPGSRFGFRTFQRFYELTMNSKKLKTMAEFIDSSYYIEFVKFGHHLASLKPIYPDQFIEFVIRNSVKLKDWTKDFVYDTYVQDLIKREPPVSAVERSITTMMDWCDKNSVPFDKFFSSVSANEAAHMIRVGKISPWVLYLSLAGDDLMVRFNEEHAKIIGDIIDPGFWMKKFKKLSDDVDYIKDILGQAGL